MVQQRRAAGPPEASAENCEIARRNLELLRSGGLDRAFPSIKADPNYERNLAKLIRKAEQAERRVCR
jgi:hypothetical protein